MKKGFTLIELMVVISVTGLLTAIAIPRFSDITQDARVAQVQENLANFNTSINMFYARHDTYPSYSEEDGDISPAGGLSEDFSDFYSSASIPATPASENTPETRQVVSERNNSGGWIYLEEEGILLANLPDGNYTGREDKELWSGGSDPDNGEDVTDPGDGDSGTGPGGSEDSDKIISGRDMEGFVHSGGWFDDLLGSFEYRESEDALELNGLFSSGGLIFTPENTGLNEISSISLKTNSKLSSQWTLTGGPDSQGLYTYTREYDTPVSTSGGGAQVEVDFKGFWGLFQDNSIYEISYR